MQKYKSDDYFRYVNGELHAEETSLSSIAKQYGTPLFVYSENAIRESYANIDSAFGDLSHTIAYAVKANGNLSILRLLASLGAGADIVSGGELLRVSEAGIPPEKVVFSGVGKRDEEIEAALKAGIRSIHIESAAELWVVSQIAKRLGKKAPIAFRVNPDVDPKTHPYIATGLHDAKFGLTFEEARSLLGEVLRDDYLLFEGLDCHIGSQLLSAEPVFDAVSALAQLASEFIDAGAKLRMLDVGGGFPVSYGDEQTPPPPVATYGEAVRKALSSAPKSVQGLEIWAEPGRALVGGAGVLLTQVLYTKDRPPVEGREPKRFVIVDAGLTELIRPALYRAHHTIERVREPVTTETEHVVDVVGPVCETGDFFALGRSLPPLERGDLLALRGAGAYASVMASHYNARPNAAEVFVSGKDARLIRNREPVEDLWRLE